MAKIGKNGQNWQKRMAKNGFQLEVFLIIASCQIAFKLGLSQISIWGQNKFPISAKKKVHFQ